MAAWEDQRSKDFRLRITADIRIKGGSVEQRNSGLLRAKSKKMD